MNHTVKFNHSKDKIGRNIPNNDQWHEPNTMIARSRAKPSICKFILKLQSLLTTFNQHLICLQIQFLHCIKQFQGIGGDNEFVDSFAVAKHIEENYPKEWHALTQIKCAFSDLGYDDMSDSTFYKIHYAPILKYLIYVYV